MANRFNLPFLGFGMGLRTDHYDHILSTLPKVDWFEVISENFMDTDGKPIRYLEKVLKHYRVVTHGVSLSIGSTDPLNQAYLEKLKKLVAWVNPPWVSDHLCWTGVQGKNSHDLLPVPYTEEALDLIVDRIKKVQDFLGRPLVLENPSTYLEFSSSSMSEAEFIARMAERADCGLLLDANNVYVTCFNHRLDPKAYIDTLPLDRVVQIHLAGHEHHGTHIIDTHDGHVVDEVWALYRYIISRTGPVTTMVEWDDHLPDFDTLAAEVEKARAFANQSQAPNELPNYLEVKDSSIKTHAYPASLDQMQASILSGEGGEAEQWIRPKKDFSSAAQLNVYIEGYRNRLFNILSGDYPVMRYYLGDEAMNQLLSEFIEHTPSTHFNVARYNAPFPFFVKVHADRFAYELALLETALIEIFDMQESAQFDPASLEGLNEEAFLNLKLLPRTAMMLLEFEYPANAYYKAFHNGEAPKKPQKKAEYIAVYRDNDILWRLPLERPEYRMILTLQQGKSIAEAMEEALSDNTQDENALAENFQRWFARWTSEKLLASI